MKEVKQNICSLLLLYAQDSFDICQEFLRQIYVPSHDAICVDDPAFLNRHILQNPDKSWLQVIFFSPGFLDFLECRPEEAFATFRYMDPTSALAVFCCGLREQEIMCYHMAPLNSYNSWPKFEVANTAENGVEFSHDLLQTIMEIFPRNNSSTNGILIVPKFISREYHKVYIIFPDVIQDTSSFSVYLETETESSIQIIPETVNPYVVYFKVPGSLMDCNHSIGVKIQHSRKILAKEELCVIKDSSVRNRIEHQESFRKLRASTQELLLEEHLRFLSDFAGPSDAVQEDETMSMLPQEVNDDTTQSLITLCKKYGLEELSRHITEPDMSINQLERTDPCHAEDPEVREAKKLNRSCSVHTDCSVENEYFQDEEVDSVPVKRSISLPSLSHSVDDCNDEGDYWDMGGMADKAFSCFPDTVIDDDNSSCSVSSNSYVCMDWSAHDNVDSLEILKRGLSDSQQELLEFMLAFKRGEWTISKVEEQFQSWHRKHAWDSACSPSAIPVSKCPMQRKPGKKIQNMRELSTGCIATSSTTRLCPLRPDTQAPPLPPKPALQSSVTKPILYPRKNIPTKLPPSPDGHRDKLDHVDDNEKIQAFIQFWEKHGLGKIAEYFLRDYQPFPENHRRCDMGTLKLQGTLSTEYDTIDSRNYLNVPFNNWEPDTQDRIQYVCEPPSADCYYDDCMRSSFSSNIYMSVKSQAGCAQDQTSLSWLSNSQQELLELMQDFKRGQKTMSQVEQHFQEWHQRHRRTSSHRKQKLLQLKSKYEKAQKQSVFGLPDIKNFILGKPKKKANKVSTLDVTNTVKQSGQSEGDSKRLSKISCTSSSSGVSDMCEVFRDVCFFNPEYASDEDERSTNNSTSSKLPTRRIPPPLPCQTPLTLPVCQLPDLVQKNSSILHENNLSGAKVHCSTSYNPKIKPTPPPKPQNLKIQVNHNITSEKTEIKKDDGNPKTDVPKAPPDSPDYIVPNRVRFGSPSQAIKKSSPESTKECYQRYIFPPKAPVPACASLTAFSKKGELSISINCPSLQAPSSKKKSNQCPLRAISSAKTTTQKRQLFKISKGSKKEESMFYVATRKWSSFPDLKNIPEPVYIQIIDEQDRRSQSISDS